MQSPSVAIVIYAPPKPESTLVRWCLELADHRPLVHWLLDRLLMAFRGVDDRVYILCRDQATRAAFEKTLFNWPTEILNSPQPSLPAALADCTTIRADLVLLLPDNAIFPDCEATKALIHNHLAQGCDVTLSANVPVGLVPIILSTRSLQHLNTLPPTQEFGEFVNSLSTVPQKCSDPNVLKVSYSGCSSPVSGHHPRLLIRDRLGLTAARQVLADSSLCTGYDGSAAASFTRHLRHIRRYPSFVYNDISRVADNTRQIILYSSASPVFSGAEESLFSLITHLDTEQFLPITVVPGRTVLGERLRSVGITVIEGDAPFLDLSNGSFHFWNSMLRDIQPALVHVDGFVNAPLLIAAQYAHIPSVFHARFFFGSRLPITIHLATKIIAISQAIERDLAENDVDPDALTVVHNGVDLARFNPSLYERQELRARAGFKPDEIVITMVARLTPAKQHSLLLSALSHLRQPLPRVRIVFVGEAYSQDAAYTNSLRRAADNLPIDIAVTWWGFEHNIAKIYAMSDWVVLATHYEPFGRCLIEAHAMGVPTIVPRSAGPLEIVSHGMNGIFYEPSDAQDLASVLYDAITDHTARDRMRHHALANRARFNITAHVDQVTALYHQLIHRAESTTELRSHRCA